MNIMNNKDQSGNSVNLIQNSLNDLDKNILFVQNINYHLNTIKNNLNLSDQNLESVNTSIIIKSNFFDKLKLILKKNPNNEALLQNIGDIFYHLIRILSKQNDDYNEILIQILFDILINLSPKENTSSVSILIKDFEILLRKQVTKNKEDNDYIKTTFKSILKLLSIFSSFGEINSIFPLYAINVLYTLLNLIEETIEKKIEQTKKSSEITDTLEIDKEEIREIVLKDEINEVIVKINSILLNTKDDKVAVKCLSIWEVLMNIKSCCLLLKQSNPLKVIIEILTKFPSDKTALAIKSCGVLMGLMEKSDFEKFITILKCKDFETFKAQETGDEYGKDASNFDSLKKNITRVLILLSKEKKFFLILKELNSLDSFISILKSDYEFVLTNQDNEEENSMLLKTNIYSELNLLLALIQNISFSENNNNFDDVAFCLFISLNYFYTENVIVNHVIDFFELYENKISYKKLFELISSDQCEKIMEKLFDKYYNNFSVINFIAKIPFYDVVLGTKRKVSTNAIFNNEIADASTQLGLMSQIYSDEKKNNFLTLITSLNAKLLRSSSPSLHNGTNIAYFNSNSFQLFCSFSSKIIDNKLIFDFNDEEKSKTYSIVFNGIENNIFCDAAFVFNDVKDNLLINLFKKISLQSSQKKISKKLIEFLSSRVHRLILQGKISIFPLFFQSEVIIDFILSNILILSQIEDLSIKKSPENILFAKIAVETLYNVLEAIDSDKKDNLLISQFLRFNGIINLIKLSYGNIFPFEIAKTIIKIIHLIAVTYFKESAILFQNYILLSNFIKKFISMIIFSTKKINDKIYAELLLYAKNIVKSCEIVDLCEDIPLISYFIKEANDIFNFSSDSSNNTLRILFEIFSLIAQNKKLLKFLDENFAVLLNNITNQLKDNFDENANNIFTSVISIFTSLYKSKEDAKIAYTNPMWRATLNNILLVIEININSIRDIMQIVEMFMTLIRFEYNEIALDALITPMFLNELLMKISKGKNFDIIENNIKKCIKMLEDPDSKELKSNSSKENENLFKELKQIAKSDRKNAISEKRHTRGVAIDIEKNQNFQTQFEGIRIQFASDIDIINEKSLNKDKADVECKNLIDLIKLIQLFAKERKNLSKIHNGFISKLISVADNQNFPYTPLNQGFILLNKLIEFDEYSQILLEDAKACDYFLNEFERMQKIIDDKRCNTLTIYEQNKLCTISKIISILSEDRSFIVNNMNTYLTETKIMRYVENLSFSSAMTVNLLTILNSVVVASFNEHELSTVSKGNIMMTLWYQFGADHTVIDQILTLTQSLYKDSYFVVEMMDNHFIANIQELLTSKNIDSDLVYHCITVIDLLMYHAFFIEGISGKSLYKLIIEKAEMNIFNTKIIDKCLSFIYKVIMSKKYNSTLVEENHIDNLCIEIINKYMKTSHSNLLSKTLEIIINLINKEDNFAFFTSKNNFYILSTAFKNNLSSKEQILRHLNLFVFIGKKHIKMIKLDPTNVERINNNYDFELICDIISDIFEKYIEVFDIITLASEVITNIYLITTTSEIKQSIIALLLQSGTKAVKKGKMEHIELILQKIYDIIISEKNKKSYTDGRSILYFINDVLKQMKINIQLLMRILNLIEKIMNEDIYKKPSTSQEIMKILGSIQSTPEFHNEIVLSSFSSILSLIYENSKQCSLIPNTFLMFIIQFVHDKCEDQSPHIQNQLLKIINNAKTIAMYTVIENKANALSISKNLYKLFQVYKENTEPKFLINIFQIISSLSILSDQIKLALNSSSEQMQLSKDIVEMLKENKFTEQLVEYQAKSCLLNLKMKNESRIIKLTKNGNFLSNHSLPVPRVHTMDLALSETQIDTDMKNFLTEKKQVKIYLENGEIQKVSINMVMNQSEFVKIIAIGKTKKGEDVVVSEMNISEMESCVRSASTQAFKKAKGFFTKKPKPNKCFTILGIKSFKTAQKTFNVECDDENVCIKYVDYISSLINNKRVSIGKKDI